jgi:hypothetical protein
MFDEMPTKEEIQEVMDNRTLYVPPRVLEGVYYSGKVLEEKWIQKLDELVTNLRETFDKDDGFKLGGEFILASKLNYDVSPLLIRANGICDFDSIEYIEKKGNFKIGPGERDSFGWLTGVITDIKTGKKVIFD